MQKDFIPAAAPLIGDDEVAAVERVLRSGMLAQGPEVAAFEREFATQFVEGRTTVAVNSGTSGQLLGLLASGVGPGDEVIVPSFTFAAVANSVVLAGATPVFVDIEPRHFTLDPARVRAAVTARTKGIMPVHLYGHPFLVDDIEEVAEDHGLDIYEDAAQAHGAAWRGRPAGTIGRFGMFSLYPTKNMTAIEGGMVSCVDEQVARRVRLLRNQGMETQYANEVVGYNNRMSEVHAAVGRVQLGRVAAWTRQRQENAAFLDAALAGIDGLAVPAVAEGAEHVYHQYTVRVAAGSATGCATHSATNTGWAPASTTRSRTTGCPRWRASRRPTSFRRPNGRRRRCSPPRAPFAHGRRPRPDRDRGAAVMSAGG